MMRNKPRCMYLFREVHYRVWLLAHFPSSLVGKLNITFLAIGENLHISLGHKKQSESQIKRFEDALTSAFFGTLRYMPPRLVVDLFISILRGRQSSAQDSLVKLCSDDVSVEMKFWPNIAETGRVEPDLLLCLSHPQFSPIDLLIECKWESSESSDFQLLRQWEALKPNNRQKTYHIYLVKYLPAGSSVRDKYLAAATILDNWDDRLLVISWLDILKALPKLSVNGLNNHSSSALKQWVKDMTAMFARIGIYEFSGFQGIAELITESEGTVFFQRPTSALCAN